MDVAKLVLSIAYGWDVFLNKEIFLKNPKVEHETFQAISTQGFRQKPALLNIKSSCGAILLFCNINPGNILMPFAELFTPYPKDLFTYIS